jgi:hypothetical protein
VRASGTTGPKEEPRLDTLRDWPEMSPWSRSGKLDWTTLTDEVSITPVPGPISSSPGADGGGDRADRHVHVGPGVARHELRQRQGADTLQGASSIPTYGPRSSR